MKTTEQDNTTVEDLLQIKNLKDKSTSPLINKLMKDNKYNSIEELLKDKGKEKIKNKSVRLAKDLVSNYNIDYSNFYPIFDKVYEEFK